MKTKIIFIDPQSALSYVGYMIEEPRFAWGYAKRGSDKKIKKWLCDDSTIVLADCDRRITWYFQNSSRGIRKLNRVIKTLTQARNLLIQNKIPRRKFK